MKYYCHVTAQYSRPAIRSCISIFRGALGENTMKRHLLSLAIGAAIVGAPSVTFAAPKVYGKINASLTSQDEEGVTTNADHWELQSNASRLGVKGKEKLTENLKGIYKLEFEVNVTDNAKSSDDHIKARNQYVGLKGGFGKVIVGRHDTPTKSAQKKVDLFSDLEGDIKHVMTGEVRAESMIQYSSPKIADIIQFKLALMPGEGGDDDSGKAQDGLVDYTSFSVTYEQDSFYAALAVDDNVKTKISDYSDSFHADSVRLVGQYKQDALKVGFIYQTSEASESSMNVDADSIFFSGSYKLDSFVFKGQYGMTDIDVGASKDVELTLLALGVDYKLSKSTKLFGYLTQVEDDAATTELERDVFGIGAEHKF
jgi:predicted porin